VKAGTAQNYHTMTFSTFNCYALPGKAGKLVLFTCLCLLLSPARAQNLAPADTLLTKVYMNDGNNFIGRLSTMDAEKLTIETEKYGTLTFNMVDVNSVETLAAAKTVGGEIWTENPQATRYLWAPNGYGLKKGEGYYQNIWVLFNQVAFGVTDNFSMGGGMVPLFLFDGTSTPVWITPKFSIPIKKDKVNFGAGALLGTVIGEETGFGIIYGIATFGDKDKNASIGLGWGFGDGEWADSPTITFNALVRTGPKGYFVTENYYIDAGGERFVLVSAGGRRMINRFSLDFALALPFSEQIDSFVAIPFLGFAVPFGNNTVKPGGVK